MSSKIYSGGLFDGRGKPQPLKVRASASKIVTPEKDIQATFFSWRDMFKRNYPQLNAIFAVPNGIWTFKAVAKSMVRQGMTAGIPDVICAHPSRDGKFHGLFIEFKSETGETSEQQEFFLKYFSDLGYRTAICRNWWTAANLVNEHLGTRIPVYPK
jgi:hypothetical protein